MTIPSKDGIVVAIFNPHTMQDESELPGRQDDYVIPAAGDRSKHATGCHSWSRNYGHIRCIAYIL